MYRVEEKMSVYQRERPSPMHTYQGIRKKMGNLGMLVGEMHGHCACRTENAQKIKAFVQTINGLKED